jgi:hypothetical protein
MKLLTTSNPKIIKGEKLAIRTAMLSLAPHKTSGYNVCPKASEGCTKYCLFGQGRGQMTSVQQSRIKKTKWLKENPDAFKTQLEKEIRNFVKLAHRQNLKPAIRLNGYSDIPSLGIEFAKLFPEVTFYDYTKLIGTLRKELPSNYHLTFSRSESNEAECKEAIALGFNVAVLFENRPKTFWGLPVIDGDETDARFLDPKGVIVGLSPKGSVKKDTSGFVVRGL